MTTTAIEFSRPEWITIQRALAGRRPALIDEEWMRSDLIDTITAIINNPSKEDTP